MNVTSRLISAGRSDVGRKRTENEDRIYTDPDRGVYLVVDGVGGQAAGERAARIATEIISTRLARQTGTTATRVREAFALAGSEIFALASAHPELKGMACVATVAVIEDDRVTVGHAGDSRLYLLEPGTIKKVTDDHSPVGEMEDAGELSEQQAMRHPRRNEVYRDLGSAPHAPDDPEFVDIRQFDLPPCSALLLCSDGLTDQVPAEEIRRVVEWHAGEPERAVLALIAAANEAGGKDNVSAILVETPQYAKLSPHAPVSRDGRGWSSLAWFLGGILAACALFLFLRPYMEQVGNARVLRFGTVSKPHRLHVGAGGFQTITAALDEARPGDTVDVGPGEYHENVRLRSRVSLVSTEVGRAKITAPGVVIEGENIRDARFAGFEVLGPAEVGLKLSGSDVEVANVKVSGMHHAGLEIDGGQPTVAASVIEQNAGIGIYIHGAASPRIEHNLIANNGHDAEPSPGVFVAGSASPYLFGNVITDNGAEQVWISPFYAGRDLLKDNIIAASAPKGNNNDIKVVTR